MKLLVHTIKVTTDNFLTDFVIEMAVYFFKETVFVSFIFQQLIL